MQSEAAEPTDEPQDAIRVERSQPAALFLRAAAWLAPTAIVVACWFGSNAAARAVFGSFDSPDGQGFFYAFIVTVFFWVLNAGLAAFAWLSVWMVGVLAITTWHKFARLY